MMGAPGFLLLLSVASLTSSLEPPVRGSVPFRPGPDLALVEGDVAVAVTQGGGQARDTYVTDPSNLWSNGRINYRFETDVWNGVEEPIFSETINKPPLLKEDRGCLPSVQVFIRQGTYSSGSYWSGWLTKPGYLLVSSIFSNWLSETIFSFFV